jgi:hypothetical protein
LYALGNIAVGNLPKHLAFILNQIDNRQKKQYLLLHSLKEVCVLEQKCNWSAEAVPRLSKAGHLTRLDPFLFFFPE